MSDTSSSEAELRVSHGCLRLPAQQLCRSRVLAIACWHPVRVSLDDLSAEPEERLRRSVLSRLFAAKASHSRRMKSTHALVCK